MKNKIHLALISGGTSGEREISVKGGDKVYEALDKAIYTVSRYDPANDLLGLIQDAPSIDAALVILHGTPGEDGSIQGLLDLLKIPYQCSGVLGSAVSMNKVVSKIFYEKAGIPVPAWESSRRGQRPDCKKIIDKLGMPLVVKPASGGSSLGMSIVKSENALEDALDAAHASDDMAIVEEYVAGTEITGAVLGNQDIEALPLVEIVPLNNHEFFDYHAKYQAGETDEICPARVDGATEQRGRDLAVMAHKALFCSGYSRTDMIVRDGRILVLETNTIPGMTPVSLLPLAASAAGMSFSELLDRLILLAMEKKALASDNR
jgi:D-alanine-D-alanine ligase